MNEYELAIEQAKYEAAKMLEIQHEALGERVQDIETALLEAFEVDHTYEIGGAFESLLNRVAYLEDRVREMENKA